MSGQLADHPRNVGFLKYWTLAQIPNLLIAGPILLPALSGSYIYLRNLLSPRIKVQQVNPALLPFHLYSLHQTLLLIFSAHTQVALRVAATNPVIWWNLAEMSFDWSEAAPRKMRKLGKVWVAWSIVWGAVSIVLWSGHYPPA
jgi:phosphatidylinositol glycan class V